MCIRDRHDSSEDKQISMISLNTSQKLLRRNANGALYAFKFSASEVFIIKAS